MPVNTAQGRQGPYVFVVGPIGRALPGLRTGTATVALGTALGVLTVPPIPGSHGLIVRGVSVRGSRAASDPSGTIDVSNNTTTMLSAALVITGNGTVAVSLADDGTEIVNPGDSVIVDLTATGAGEWDSTEALEVTVSVYYDELPR